LLPPLLNEDWCGLEIDDYSRNAFTSCSYSCSCSCSAHLLQSPIS
jgi:hypothetical protein